MTKDKRHHYTKPEILVNPIVSQIGYTFSDLHGDRACRFGAYGLGWYHDAACRMGGEENVARQHAQGRMTARERIDALCDSGSFRSPTMWPRNTSGSLTCATPFTCLWWISRHALEKAWKESSFAELAKIYVEEVGISLVGW